MYLSKDGDLFSQTVTTVCDKWRPMKSRSLSFAVARKRDLLFIATASRRLNAGTEPLITVAGTLTQIVDFVRSRRASNIDLPIEVVDNPHTHVGVSDIGVHKLELQLHAVIGSELHARFKALLLT
jgi:hypothetical protein